MPAAEPAEAPPAAPEWSPEVDAMAQSIHLDVTTKIYATGTAWRALAEGDKNRWRAVALRALQAHDGQMRLSL